MRRWLRRQAWWRWMHRCVRCRYPWWEHGWREHIGREMEDDHLERVCPPALVCRVFTPHWPRHTEWCWRCGWHEVQHLEVTRHARR